MDHFYAHQSTSALTISATAFDADGAESDADTQELTVDDVAPTITADWGGEPEVGEPYDIALHSSDPGGDAVGDVTVDWDDNSTPDTITGGDGVAEHVYADPGNYTISLDGPTGASMPSPHAATAAAPTSRLFWLEVVGDAMTGSAHGDLGIDSKHSGDGRHSNLYVDIAPTSSAAANEVMTILNGSVVIDANSIPGCPGHTFTFPSPDAGINDSSKAFDILVNNIGGNHDIHGHIAFYAQDAHGCYSQCFSHQWTFTFHALTVGVESSDYSQEGSTAHVGHFTFTRTDTSCFAPAVDLSGAVTFAGCAISGTDYTPLSNHVRFAAGQSSATSSVYAIDDKVSEWTEDVVAMFASNSDFYVVLGKQGAWVEIVDNDVGIGGVPNGLLWANTDDDNHNGVEDCDDRSGFSDDDLIPITFDYPQEIRPNATITVGLTDATATLWSTASRTVELLGPHAGDSLLMIMTPGGAGLIRSAFLEITHGSTAAIGAAITIWISDATALLPGTSVRPNPPTSTQATVTPPTASARLIIDSPAPSNNEWEDAYTVALGEQVRAHVAVSAPSGTAWSTAWEISGKVFNSYNPAAQASVLDSSVNTKSDSLTFRWWQASTNKARSPELVEATVTAGGHKVVRGDLVTVLTPDVSQQPTRGPNGPRGASIGTCGMSTVNDHNLPLAPSPDRLYPEGWQGFQWNAQVSAPQGAAFPTTARWAILNVVNWNWEYFIPVGARLSGQGPITETSRACTRVFRSSRGEARSAFTACYDRRCFPGARTGPR